jgi:hypothetical protein
MAEDRNPYAAPKAVVRDVESQELGDFVPEGRKVDAGRGWSWIAEGFAYFKRAPGAWIGLMLVFLLIVIVLSIIPFVGSIAVNLLFAVFMAGIMAGCKAIEDGDGLRVGHLFSGFSMSVGQLVLVGLLYLLFIIGVVVVMMLMMGGLGAFGDMQGGNFGPGFLVAMLVAFALFIPAIMAIWFAPALVGLNNLSAVRGMGASFKACLKNIVPFLIYGLVFLGIFLVVALVLGGIAGAGMFAGGQLNFGMMAVVGLLYLAFALIIGPVTMGSMYAAYRDIFYEA